MALERILNDLLKDVDGSIGIAIAGFDGMSVATAQSDPNFKMEDSVASAAMGLSTSQKMMRDAGAGAVKESMTTTDAAIFFMRPIDEEYWLGIALAANGNLGKARLELKKALPRIQKELQ
ncbi:MAG: roadblock/LC7 domain-containing protein [Candidatus Syntropharchaeales archaeon]